MPYRKIIHATGEVYHIFNKGIAGMPIYPSQSFFTRFIDLINYYQYGNTPFSYSVLMKIPVETRRNILSSLEQEQNRCIEIFAFCLMDNHYHFLAKQLKDNGIASFISKIQNGYAKYFNVKSERSGPLFQPMFKSVRVETDEQLLHVSRYIHLNPSTGYLVRIENLLNYPWSSLPEYVSDIPSKFNFIYKELILGILGTQQKYKSFVFDQAEYQRELAKIKHLILK